MACADVDVPESVAKAGVSYPLIVPYCGECGLPVEYCEFGSQAEACKKWLQTALPEQFERLHMAETEADEEGAADATKKKKRGGKGIKKPVKAKEAEVEAHVTLQRSHRGKNKSVTVLRGLKSAGVDLKVASKFFSKKFACSSSVTGDDEIVIQGDVKDDLLDMIPEQWPQVSEDCIEDLGDQKR